MRPTELQYNERPVEIAAGVRIRLHPNLARIAASYQEICDRFGRGTIDTAQAALEIRDLVARDDDGVQWTINPRDGGWLFCSKQHGWQPGMPPQSGLATLTAHDLSDRHSAGSQMHYNPDADISWTEVSDEDGRTLAGATRRVEHQPAGEQRTRRTVVLLVAVAIAAAAAVGLYAATDGVGSGEQAPTVQPAG